MKKKVFNLKALFLFHLTFKHLKLYTYDIEKELEHVCALWKGGEPLARCLGEKLALEGSSAITV